MLGSQRLASTALSVLLRNKLADPAPDRTFAKLHVLTNLADAQTLGFDHLSDLEFEACVKGSSGFLMAHFCRHLGLNKPIFVSFEIRPPHTVIADKAYDAQQRVVEPLLKAGKAAVIPSLRTRRVQRPYDRHLYKARHLIENFLARLKQYRAIATRYDKTAAAFLGAIHLAAAVVWLIWMTHPGA